MEGLGSRLADRERPGGYATPGRVFSVRRHHNVAWPVSTGEMQ